MCVLHTKLTAAFPPHNTALGSIKCNFSWQLTLQTILPPAWTLCTQGLGLSFFRLFLSLSLGTTSPLCQESFADSKCQLHDPRWRRACCCSASVKCDSSRAPSIVPLAQSLRRNRFAKRMERLCTVSVHTRAVPRTVGFWVVCGTWREVMITLGVSSKTYFHVFSFTLYACLLSGSCVFWSCFFASSAPWDLVPWCAKGASRCVLDPSRFRRKDNTPQHKSPAKPLFRSSAKRLSANPQPELYL